MKRLLLLLVFFSVGCLSFSDEYVIFAGDCSVYNDLLKTFTDSSYAIKFDDEQKLFYLFTADFLTKGWVILSSDDLATLRNCLDKFLEWEKTAVEKNVEIEKEIPNSMISTKVGWKYGDDWYQAGDLDVHFTFFSQSGSRHQLVIESNKVVSSQNQFVSFKLGQLYLEKDQVIALSRGILEQSLNKAIAEHEKKKATEEMFQ
jgi:hypothetical protein